MQIIKEKDWAYTGIDDSGKFVFKSKKFKGTEIRTLSAKLIHPTGNFVAFLDCNTSKKISLSRSTMRKHALTEGKIFALEWLAQLLSRTTV